MSNHAETLRRYFDAINARDLTTANNLVADDCVIHSGGRTVAYHDAIQAEQEGWEIAPNRKCQIEDVVTEGDRVAARWRSLEQGESVTSESLSIYRLEDAKLVEAWHATAPIAS